MMFSVADDDKTVPLLYIRCAPGNGTAMAGSVAEHFASDHTRAGAGGNAGCCHERIDVDG